MEHLPAICQFQKCVSRYRGDYSTKKSFSLVGPVSGGTGSFAQFTYRESLRDIEACLTVRKRQAGTTWDFAARCRVQLWPNANEARDWRIFADFAQVLIAIAWPLYVNDPIGVDLDASLYALDSTTIDLCLSLFPLGPIPSTQGRYQIAHAVGPARQYPNVYRHYRWQGA